MNIDQDLLHAQYSWLLTLPDCDAREGLLNLIENLRERDLTNPEDIRFFCYRYPNFPLLTLTDMTGLTVSELKEILLNQEVRA